MQNLKIYISAKVFIDPPHHVMDLRIRNCAHHIDPRELRAKARVTM